MSHVGAGSPIVVPAEAGTQGRLPNRRSRGSGNPEGRRGGGPVSHVGAIPHPSYRRKACPVPRYGAGIQRCGAAGRRRSRVPRRGGPPIVVPGEAGTQGRPPNRRSRGSGNPSPSPLSLPSVPRRGGFETRPPRGRGLSPRTPPPAPPAPARSRSGSSASDQADPGPPCCTTASGTPRRP